MEIVIGLGIVIGLLVVLGVSPLYIMEGVFVLMILVMAATFVFFAYIAVSLIGSKKRRAVFDRIDKPEKKPFPSAVYNTDDGEMRNSFPNEFVLKNRLYKKNREVFIRVTKRGGVYDRYSQITVIAGLILGGCSLWLLISALVSFI